MALKQPIPDEERARKAPHYLRLRGQTNYSTKRSLIDPRGAIDENGKRVAAEIKYTFFQGRATPVGNTEHAVKLLEILARQDIEEVAYRERAPKVEEFHPQFTRGPDAGEYDESKTVQVTTVRYEPTDVVVRTGKDYLALSLEERKKAAKLPPVHIDDVEEQLDVDDLDSLKVPQLREELKKAGLSTSGNRDELLARLKGEEEGEEE